MSDGSGIDEDLSEDALRKDRVRLARRVARLEATLESVELIRDTNSRLLDRLMVELETERATSQRLLRNVLPQPIIDRLNAGERLIADRYDDVAIVFSDFVGFTEISARLPVTTLVSSLNTLFSAFDASCQDVRRREDQDDRRRLHGRGRPSRIEQRATSRGGGPRARHARGGARRRATLGGSDRPAHGTGRRRCHRQQQVRLRPVGRRGQRGQSLGSLRAARLDPGLRRSSRMPWRTPSNSSRAARSN